MPEARFGIPSKEGTVKAATPERRERPFGSPAFSASRLDREITSAEPSIDVWCVAPEPSGRADTACRSTAVASHPEPNSVNSVTETCEGKSSESLTSFAVRSLDRVRPYRCSALTIYADPFSFLGWLTILRCTVQVIMRAGLNCPKEHNRFHCMSSARPLS